MMDDFPAPFGPSNPVTVASSATKLTLLTATIEPWLFVTPLTSIIPLLSVIFRKSRQLQNQFESRRRNTTTATATAKPTCATTPTHSPTDGVLPAWYAALNT